ncbi:MAG: hypothetical protein IJ784_13260 [Ruminiclostridium sp.]|nr:hypothetical protein [Ruminiclostridium sp.]
MKKSIGMIAAALAAASAMSCTAVPAFAAGSEYFTYVDTIAGIQFDSMEDLIAFIAKNRDKSTIEKIEPEASDWLLTTDSLFVPSAVADNISDIAHIIITPTYVSTMFEKDSKIFELYAYIDNKAGTNAYKIAQGQLSEGLYDSHKTTLGGSTLYFSQILGDGNYTWKEDGKYYWLRVYNSTGYNEDDLKFCSIVAYPLTETKVTSEAGWKTIDSRKYYYDESGNKVTKATTIDGVLYKFGNDGVCSGKYSGWARTKTGRYYYKNGVKLKSCWIKSGGKKTYYLLKSGKMATGTVKIGGKKYTFGDNGKLIDK